MISLRRFIAFNCVISVALTYAVSKIPIIRRSTVVVCFVYWWVGAWAGRLAARYLSK